LELPALACVRTPTSFAPDFDGIHDRKEEFARTIALEAASRSKVLAWKWTRRLHLQHRREETVRGYGEYLPLDWQQSTAVVGASSSAFRWARSPESLHLISR